MPVEIKHWSDRLQAILDAEGGPFRRVTVVRETDSTQDEARRLAARPGDVVVAERQASGRGRLGRAWVDTAGEGAAATFVAEPATPERLVLVSAVAAAEGAEAVLGRPVGIKWPNDIVADDRKLAGVLVEQSDVAALIGIGMNVLQTRWSDELADRAVSLAQLGAKADRLETLESLVRAMDRAMMLPDDELLERYRDRDVLRGTEATFCVDGRTVTGTVVRVDPVRGLVVRRGNAEVFLPAATTRVERK